MGKICWRYIIDHLAPLFPVLAIGILSYFNQKLAIELSGLAVTLTTLYLLISLKHGD